MKIRVAVTLDVDPFAYMDEYGVEREEIRDDVQRLAQHALMAHFSSIGVLQ